MPDDKPFWRDVLGSQLPDDQWPEPEPEPPQQKPSMPSQSKGNAPMPRLRNDGKQQLVASHERDVVKKYVRSVDAGALNFSLLFHRYLSEADYNKGGDKSGVFWFLTKAAAKFFADQTCLLEKIREQSCEAVRCVCDPWGWIPITIEFTERLAIGLGGPSVFDTGITLHHLSGAPYLPASSLKGLARATALEELVGEYGVPYLDGEKVNVEGLKRFEKLLAWAPPRPSDSAESKAERQDALNTLLQDVPRAKISKLQGMTVDDWHELARGSGSEKRVACFRLAFGTQSARGQVVFSDAHPENLNGLDPDLVNPHYGKYYERPGVEQPADYHSPIPAFFLTVLKGTRFQFVLGSLPPDPTIPVEPATLREQVKQWLTEGLEGTGIGAKTAVGYGAAKVIPSAP